VAGEEELMISEDVSIALYKSIREANEERVFDDWHASAMANCPRAHYFKRLGIKPINEPTGAKILRWSAGHYLEAGIRPHIEKLYKGVGSNERMTSTTLHLTGEFDNYAEDDQTLIEVKSVSDWAFWEEGKQLSLKEEAGTKMGRNGREIKNYVPKLTPYLHHEIQQHCYVLLLEELGKQVKAIDYVYISLNGRIVVYKTEPQPELTEAIKRRLAKLNEAWDKQEPPECICKPDNKLWGPVLQWCDYREEGGCCKLELIK
jgi:hypothetical protein